MTREEAKVYIIRHCNPEYPKGKTEWGQAINIAVDALEQPEIIRCKECKYFYENRWCIKYLKAFLPDDFCSCAERREEGDE